MAIFHSYVSYVWHNQRVNIPRNAPCMEDLPEPYWAILMGVNVRKLFTRWSIWDMYYVLVGGLEHFLFSIHWECHHPNWLSYFSEGLKPPSSVCFFPIFVLGIFPPTMYVLVPAFQDVGKKKQWSKSFKSIYQFFWGSPGYLFFQFRWIAKLEYLEYGQGLRVPITSITLHRTCSPTIWGVYHVLW